MTEDERFEQVNFTGKPLKKDDYEYCSFQGCDLSGTDLSGFHFVECTFSDCNLSLVKLADTVFREVQFSNCKMLGLQFDTCNEYGLGVSYKQCVLNHSSFYKTRLKKVLMDHCELREVDFTQADLTEAVLSHCELAGATFEHTVLEKADLRGSVNLVIDPERNRLKHARFSPDSLAGLLGKYQIKVG